MISIIGNGSIGLAIGALFSHAGIDVRIVTRRVVNAEFIEAEGYIEGKFKAEFSQDIGDPELIIVAVKAYHLKDAVKKITKDIPSLFLQNGLDILDLVKGHVKKPVRGVTGIGAYRIAPNKVHIAGVNFTMIGITPDGTHERFVDLRRSASLPVDVGDVKFIERRKAVMNAGINPVTALLRIRNGELLERKDALNVTLSATREATEIAKAYGVNLENVEDILIKGISRTKANYSSMAMDVMNGRQTEIDYINGKIVEKARAKGLEAKVNETLWRLVRALSPRCTGIFQRGRCFSCIFSYEFHARSDRLTLL